MANNARFGGQLSKAAASTGWKTGNGDKPANCCKAYDFDKVGGRTMKKTIGKTALTLVAAIVMILLVAVLIAIPAYASVDPAQYVTPKQTIMFIAGLFVILALGVPFILLFVGAGLGANDSTTVKIAFALCSGFASIAGGLYGLSGWLW